MALSYRPMKAAAIAAALALASLAVMAAGVTMQRADMEARQAERAAAETQRIHCADGSIWPSDVRQGACSGRGGIAR